MLGMFGIGAGMFAFGIAGGFYSLLFASLVIAVGGALIFAFLADFGLRGVYFAAAFGMVAYGVMIAGSLKFGAWRS